MGTWQSLYVLIDAQKERGRLGGQILHSGYLINDFYSSDEIV